MAYSEFDLERVERELGVTTHRVNLFVDISYAWLDPRIHYT